MVLFETVIIVVLEVICLSVALLSPAFYILQTYYWQQKTIPAGMFRPHMLSSTFVLWLGVLEGDAKMYLVETGKNKIQTTTNRYFKIHNHTNTANM